MSGTAVRGLAGLLLAAGLAGCVLSLDREPPLLTPEEVVAMHRAGVPAPVIAAKVLVSRVAAPLTVPEMVRLKDEGIDERLIERMVAASATAAPIGGVVYYHAPYGPYPLWTADADEYPAPTAHPYWGHPDWVHRQRAYEAR